MNEKNITQPEDPEKNINYEQEVNSAATIIGAHEKNGNKKGKFIIAGSALAGVALAAGAAFGLGHNEDTSSSPNNPTVSSSDTNSNNMPNAEKATPSQEEILRDFQASMDDSKIDVVDRSEWVNAIQTASNNPSEAANVLSSIGVNKTELDALDTIWSDVCALPPEDLKAIKLTHFLFCGSYLVDYLKSTGVYKLLPENGKKDYSIYDSPSIMKLGGVPYGQMKQYDIDQVVGVNQQLIIYYIEQFKKGDKFGMDLSETDVASLIKIYSLLLSGYEKIATN